MLKLVAVAVGVALAALLVAAATKPDTLRVERTALMDAPAQEIFPLIEDFHRWGPWSPYEKRDPAMKRTYGGAERGQGSVYAWEGNRDIGKGRMEIVESVPPSRIALTLDFEEPFEAHNVVQFTLEPEGGATRVTWAMQGPASFVSKLMSVFVDMDGMIGRDFEAGLANLTSLVEK